MPDYSSSSDVTLVSWDEIPLEKLSPNIGRKLVSGSQAMLAHVYLDKGAIVPKHQHVNEQITYILKGTLRFWIGEDEGKVVDVHEGQVLHIPSNVWHKAEALEDTLDVARMPICESKVRQGVSISESERRKRLNPRVL
jgi:quercetin dioxygenase-like cupin family protein